MVPEGPGETWAFVLLLACLLNMFLCITVTWQYRLGDALSCLEPHRALVCSWSSSFSFHDAVHEASVSSTTRCSQQRPEADDFNYEMWTGS